MKKEKEEKDFVESITNQAQRLASFASLAQFYRDKYLALVEAGFTPHESLEIIKARGLQV